MNRQEFLSAFQAAMEEFGVSDRAAHRAFFEELFDDMAEEGTDEAEISARLGDPRELAEALFREERENGQPPRQPAGGAIQPAVREPEREYRSDDRGREEKSASGQFGQSWRDRLNRLLNAAGIQIDLGGWGFGLSDRYDTVIPAAGIDELELHWLAGELEVRPEERQDILLSEWKNENAPPLRAETRGSSLCVFYAGENTRINSSKNLTVFLPLELAGRLRRCTVQTLSADATIEGLTVSGELRVRTASGDQSVSAAAGRGEFSAASGDLDLDLDVRELSATTASGDLKLSTQGGTERAKLSTASGDLDCRGTFLSLSMNSASGDIGFTGGADSLYAKTASGDCGLELGIVPAELDISSLAGDVKIRLPGGTACRPEISSRTGDVRVSGIRTDAPDSPVFRVRTISGDVRISD